MGRSRGGGGGGGRAPARKAVASPASRQAPPPAARQAPPPAQHAPPPAAQHAPPPMHAPQQSGGLMSGLGGMVAQGMALGVGSSIGHKMVDGAVGMFSGGSGHQEAAPQQQQYQGAVPQGNYNQSVQGANACTDTQRELYQCLQENNQNAAACQFYFDALRMCQENTSVSQFN